MTGYVKAHLGILKKKSLGSKTSSASRTLELILAYGQVH